MPSRKKSPPRRSDASRDHALDRRETAESGRQERDGNDEWIAALESTHDAVCAYARKEFQVLTRKVIYRLQRIRASGIYGDDYIYKTLCDEYCHEVQEGSHDMPGLMGLPSIAGAWEMTLQPLLEDVIESVPRHAAE